MSRARGANSALNVAFEAVYGVPPPSGFFTLPFVSHSLGEEQNLVENDVLGFGREPQAPSLDVIVNDGDVVVPWDLRNAGIWLKGTFGAPTTTQGVAATGSYTFSAQPANNSIITVGGQAFTFVTGVPTANQIKI
ncbi:MAG TPA: phage tail tube protein, partial [bacterium]|nr:phage tail tube protein [bacterium]